MNLPPDHALALYEEAMELVHRQEFDEALERGRLLEASGFSGGFEVMALALRAKGQLDEALRVLREGVEAVPEVWVLWQLLGNVHSDRREFLEAHEAYERALACPRVDRGSVSINRAVAFLREKRSEEALATADAVPNGRFILRAAILGLTARNELGRHDEVLLRAPAVLDLAERFRAAGEDAKGEYEVQAEWARALWEGRSDREGALTHARRAVRDGVFVRTAATVILRASGETSDEARRFSLVVRGRWTLPSHVEGDAGFFRTFEIVAKSPGQALAFAREFEPETARSSLAVEYFEDLGPEPEAPMGVYRASGHSVHALDAN